jgi:hypothetical protein
MTNWQIGKPAILKNNGWATQVTPSGSNHTKGSWATAASSIGYDISGFLFCSTNPWSGQRLMTDLAIGDASNKYILVDNLINNYNSTYTQRNETTHWVPMRIAAGSNIYLRGQSSVGGDYYRATIIPYGGNFHGSGFGRSIVLGDNTGDTGGQALTTSYVELTSSLSFAVKMMYVSIIHLTYPSTYGEGWVYVAVGSSGNEVPIYSRRITGHNSSVCVWGHPDSHALPVNIAQGSRVSIKVTDSDANNKIDGIVYCYG